MKRSKYDLYVYFFTKEKNIIAKNHNVINASYILHQVIVVQLEQLTE